MLFGNKGEFAVDINVEDIFDGWVLGTYQFWVRGISIGDGSDHSVDLKGCWNWMRDFISHARERYAPNLYEMNKQQVYLRLAASVLPSQNPSGFSKEMYDETFSRFHISHIGMSSFERLTLLLVKNEQGMERLIWSEGGGGIQDAYLGASQIEDVFADAVNSLEGTMLSAGDKV